MEAREVDVGQLVRHRCAQHRLVPFVVVLRGRPELDLHVGVRLHEGLRDRLVVLRKARLRIQDVERHLLCARGRSHAQHQRRRACCRDPLPEWLHDFLLGYVAAWK